MQIAKSLYDQIIKSPQDTIDLNNVIAMPFIHEFAFCYYTDEELKERVSFFLSILDGDQFYRYSAFFKLPPPSQENKAEYELYHNLGDIELTSLRFFDIPIRSPATIKDILWNSISDILLNTYPSEDDCIDSVNCGEPISYSNIEKRVKLLLSYYLGIEPFLFQVTLVPSSNKIYTIL